MVGTLMRSVLSQDSMKSLAGDNAQEITAKVKFEMHRNYYYYDKNNTNNSKHLFVGITVAGQHFRNSRGKTTGSLK